MSEELLVQGTGFTTPEYYDPKVKAKAYELFLTTDLNLTDIAMDLGVKKHVVAIWSKEGNWIARKREIESELFKSAEDKYRALISQNRAPVVERHLKLTKTLEETIGKVLDETLQDDGLPSDMKLKRLAEALSTSAAVSARAAGITDKPFSEDSEDGNKRKVPLIMLNVQAVQPPEIKSVDPI